MRRIWRFSALALALAGCGDPATDVLGAHSAARLFDLEKGEVTVEVPAKDPEGVDVLRTVRVPAGTRVIVLEDSRANPPISATLRLVRVQIDEGAQKGTIGGVNRQELRAGR